MTSILKADTIQDAAGNNIINENANTITIGASGDTITIPSGATIANSGTATGFGGITMADQWRYTSTSTLSSTATVISSNLERNDSSSAGFIGSAMTESSGIFTFPSTGIYLVQGFGNFAADSDNRYVILNLQVTTNNSSYSNFARGRSHIEYSYGTTYTQGIASGYVDVTDTSNVKVRFTAESEGTATLFGNTDSNNTWFQFIRLGDT